MLLVGAAVLVAGGVGVGLFGRGLPAGDGQTLVIRKGGTYSGTYRSPDSGVPCVRIETTEPVTLQNCVLTGAGNLIHANAGGAQLTVLNCRGYGLMPSRDQTRRGRFLEASSARSVRVEHNYFEQTSGISIYRWSGDGTATQTLTVRYNQCRNLDGRLRDGGEEFCNFLGLNAVPALENIEVAWNEVVNEPDKSLVADNINFYNSGGTRRSPARVHDNYIQGAYPYPATGPRYDGSGITLDGDGRAELSATAFVDAYSNQIISTCGAAMNIAAGHDNHFHDNRMVTSGQLPDGTHLPSSWAASAIWNAYKQPPGVFHSNQLSRNVVGYVHWGGSVPFPNRQDLSPGLCEACTGTTHLPNPITPQTEQAEWTLWQQKLGRQNMQVGSARAAVRATHALPRLAQAR
jgi:hypothetical protein